MNIHHARNLRVFLITAALTFGLAGCGGGGGSNVKPSSASPTTVYGYNTDHLTAIGADQAQAAGDTGQNVTIGLVDSGIRTTHREFSNGSRILPGYNVIDGTTDVTDTSPIGHGTGTASLAAGANVGVAPDADILPVRVTDSTGGIPNSGTPYICGSGTTYACAAVAKGVDYQAQHSAQVINLSATFYNSDDNAKALNEVGAAGKLLIVAAGNNGAANPDSAGLLQSGNLVPLTTAAIDSFLIVGSVDSSNQIASWSNRAGTAMDRYLVAPGVNITMATNTSDTAYTTQNGTSLSTPLVSGAAALVWSADPSLTAKQVADILLQTADDLGAPGVDSVYGYGKLDVAAAMRPVGVLTVPQGSTASGPSLLTTRTTLNLGPAFGDALTSIPSLQSVVALDAFQRPYVVNLSKTVTSDYQGVALINRMTAFLDEYHHMAAQAGGTRIEGYLTETRRSDTTPAFADDLPAVNPIQSQALSLTNHVDGLPVTYGFGLNPVQFTNSLTRASGLTWLSDSNANPYMQLADHNVQGFAVGGGLGHGISLRAGFAGGEHTLGLETTGTQVRMDVFDMSYAHGPLDMHFNVGQTVEHGSVLGSTGGGAAPTHVQSVTTMLGVSSEFDLTRNTAVVGTYRFGLTHVQGANTGLFRDWSGIHSDAMNLGVVSHGVLTHGDVFGVEYSRPLRVDSGTVQVNVPVARDLDHNVYRTEQQVNLNPTGTEQDLELAYRTPTGKASTLGLNLLYQVDPGHVAAAAPVATAMVTFRTGF